ncbi:hypothetical protein BESB_006810 [Besnoitia besnoiti]|uniref:CCHC-type domain-containing protein n=1 Tax=Besnoitia besnoiti TaxID=94643 RepID=A0A2A9MQK5_BESBE|nr:hypothetical protein BESB_006810 [Besnoitia besnoiti]PFH38340.1 hypothetical protein BESB_006810 [Besnoitia besnoiti]
MVSVASSSALRSVQWRFKGSNTPYSPLSLPLPVFCGEIRAHLKAQTGLGATPQLDALLFFASDPSTPLSDLLPLRRPCSLLLQRTSAAEAKAALEVADRVLQQQQKTEPGLGDIPAHSSAPGESRGDASSTLDSVSRPVGPALSSARGSGVGAGPNDAASSSSFVYGGPQASAGQVHSSLSFPVASFEGPQDVDRGNNDEEDEAALLQAVIEQHAEHRGPQTSGSAGPCGAAGGFGSADGSRGFSGGFYPAGAGGFGRGRGWGFGVGRGLQGPPMGTHGPGLTPATAGGLAGAPYAVGRGGAVGLGMSNVPGGPGYVPVGEDYICHMCGERGHHIRNCSRSNDPRHQKKIRPATGIPSSFLRDITVDEIPRYAEVYIRKDGSFAVMKNAKQLSSLSYFSSDLDTKIERHVGSSDVAAHLKCPLCSLLFSQPVLTPCCGETFCRGCLLRALHVARGGAAGGAFGGSSAGSSHNGFSKKPGGGCPSCGQAIDLREVLSNTALQKSIDAIVRSTSSFKEPGDDTQSTRPTLTAALSSTTSVSGSGVLTSATGSVQRAAPNGVSLGGDIVSSGSSLSAASVAHSASKRAIASSSCGTGDPCLIMEKGEKKDPLMGGELHTEWGKGLRAATSFVSAPKNPSSVNAVKKEEDKENMSIEGVMRDGSAGAISPMREAYSVQSEHVESEASCPDESAALKGATGMQPSRSDDGDASTCRASGNESVEAASTSATPANGFNMDGKNLRGDPRNGTYGEGSVGSSGPTNGGPGPEEAESGLPPGVDVEELQEQQAFADVYITQYLQRRREEKKKRRMRKRAHDECKEEKKAKQQG